MIREIFATRRIDQANELLRLGCHLLDIGKDWRGPIFILGAQTLEVRA